MNRTVGAGRKGVAAVSRSAEIQPVGDEEEAGVDGVAGRCTVAVRRHLGAESELDLRSAPSPSASPSLSLEHHPRRRRRLVVAENRDRRTAWRRVEELGYGESAGAAGPGALENAWEGSLLGHL